MNLNDTFTSTGVKFFAHQEAMANLRDGRGQPIVTHVMATDICNHSCAFCSVQARAGDTLPLADILAYLDTLRRFGLKAVILSGGGNPILYKCPHSHANFNDLVSFIHERGLEIGLITNGMPMKVWDWKDDDANAEWSWPDHVLTRESWKLVKPSTLDKLMWVRISMSGLDHDEREVYVPDIDPAKTTLGFSYVGHDLYREPADPHHGKVSTPHDLMSGNRDRAPDWTFEERMQGLTEQIARYNMLYHPKYIRLLPNCLEPELIPRRYKQLEAMARAINSAISREVVFVQHKPPRAPHACYLGYIHPVLNCDGYVYPCDSCVLNEAAGHAFANPWRVCHWRDVASVYEQPVRSLIADPVRICPGCVFTQSNELLGKIVDGTADVTPSTQTPEHVNFV